MTVMTPDRIKLRNLLCDTLLSLCRNGLDYENNLRIDALIGITVDNSDVFLISLQDTVRHENSPKSNEPLAIKIEPEIYADKNEPSLIRGDSEYSDFEAIVNGIESGDDNIHEVVLLEDDKDKSNNSDEINNHLKIETIEMIDDLSDETESNSTVSSKKGKKLRKLLNQTFTDYSFYNPSLPSTSNNYSQPVTTNAIIGNIDGSFDNKELFGINKTLSNPELSLPYQNFYDKSGVRLKGIWSNMYNGKIRKTRSIFTHFQLKRLEEVFKEHQYINMELRRALSEELNLSLYVINVWFQNRRNRFKRALTNT